MASCRRARVVIAANAANFSHHDTCWYQRAATPLRLPGRIRLACRAGRVRPSMTCVSAIKKHAARPAAREPASSAYRA